MEEKLSVIVPIYNVEKYLRQCIDSIMAQTYKNIEIILIDDGSTDNSGAICDEYKNNYENIVVIHKKNEGVIRARLDGVKRATAEYVVFADSDDFVEKNMYFDMMKYASESDMVISQIYRYYTDTNIVSESMVFDKGTYDKNDIYNKIIPNMLYSTEINRWAIDPALWTKIFRRKMVLDEFENIKNLDVWYGDDTSIVFPYVLKCKNIYIMDKAYYYHRQRMKGEVPYYLKDELFNDKLKRVYDYLDNRFKQTEFYGVLKPQLDHFYENSILIRKHAVGEIKDEEIIKFPYELISKDSKVIIYGAGKYGKEYIRQNEENKYCEVVRWVDKRYEFIKFYDYKIDSPDMILQSDFDYIIIAIEILEAVVKVRQYLLELGVDKKKIIWYGGRITDDN